MDKSELRRRASEQQRLRQSRTATLSQYSLEQIEELVRELEIHQIELEIQNSELQESRRVLEDSRQRYLALYNQAPVGYLTLDSYAKIIELNPAAERLLQQGGSSPVGESLCKYVSSEHRDPLFLAIRSFFKTGEPLQMELQLACENGRPPCHVVLEANLTEVSGTYFGRVALLDVTERRILQDRIARARKLEGVAQLAGGVAHDFNNLMTVVGGCCEILLEQLPENGLQRELVQDIQRAGERASQVTSQLLDIGRTSNPSDPLIDLNSAVEEAAGSLQQLVAGEIGLEIETTEQPLLVTAELGEIGRILENLVANSSDSQPAGGMVRIQTSKRTCESTPLSPSSSMGTFAALAVSDHGCGISSSDQSRIFEPFFSTKPRDEAAGLGLAVVYAIVRRRGGLIEVESEIDKGTTITVFLPLTDQESPTGDRQNAPKTKKSKFVGTILVVEDEGSVRRLVARILRSDGHHVVVSDSGEDALARFTSQPESIDLLLTDVVMPGMGGLELARRLRTLSETLPILFMSGYTEDTVRKEMGPLRAEFIAKPFSRRGLLATVQKTYFGLRT